MARLCGPARRFALGAFVAALLATSFVAIGGATAGASTKSFCTAQENVSLDTTSAAAVKKQVAKLLKAKPPAEVAKALKAIKKAGGGAAVKNALTVVAAFVASSCGSSTGSSSGGSNARCPLSAEQVSAALGATVDKDEASCTYFPPDAAFPNATFVRQLALACDSRYLSELGYSESLSGLGKKAFIQRSAPAHVLVCTDSPFEIEVDIPGNSDAAIAAVQQLAKDVLGS